MKKLILASLIASSMTMADVNSKEAEESKDKAAVEKSTNWDFKGQGVFYYQTTTGYGNSNWLNQPTSAAAAGLQLSAVNKDLGNGIGAGFELSGLSSAGLHNDFVGSMVQNAGGTTDGAITQAYLTYGLNNTSLKAGRQTLPKALSPFAYSEGWNVFKNTFDALLVVNSDIQDTTLVGAYVHRANNSLGDLSSFNEIWGADAVYMLTAQNKSVENLTLTGSFYHLDDVADVGENQQALWGDAKYDFGNSMKLAGQFGRIYGDFTDSIGGKDTKAFGMMVSGEIAGINTSLAYSSVNKGSIPLANIAGSGVKSPLYTQGVLNQNGIKIDSNSLKLSGSMKAMGGTFIAAYMTSELGENALPSVLGLGVGGAGTYQEIELLFKKKVSKNVNMFFGYVNQDDDRQGDDDNQHFFRVWARYNF